RCPRQLPAPSTMSQALSSRVAFKAQTARPARRSSVQVVAHLGNVQKAAGAALASVLVAGSAHALSFDELQGLTYLQVKGSGIANTCPTLDNGSSNIKDLKAGTYSLGKFCMEPTSFTVKEESQFKGGSAASR
ncbi:photosystem II manganese-stabilizing polypeptide, partial [Klebsiella pneumoniae]|uniref:photosystem II manganese-stabilizing polypeptide n=2 Tax=Klebsiella pneumoniae TaxID=573 RepID=UPI0025A16E73